MFSDVRRHVIYQIASAATRTYPFTHLVIDDVFPAAFYAKMQALLPDDGDYTPLVQTGRVSATYSPRRLAFFERETNSNRLSAAQRTFWTDAFAALHHEDLGAWILAKFYDVIAARLGLEAPDAHMDLQTEIFLMRDLDSYMLGPHTDSPSKVASVLFYLPANAARPRTRHHALRAEGSEFRLPGRPALRRNEVRSDHDHPLSPEHHARLPQDHDLLPWRGARDRTEQPPRHHGVRPEAAGGHHALSRAAMRAGITGSRRRSQMPDPPSAASHGRDGPGS